MRSTTGTQAGTHQGRGDDGQIERIAHLIALPERGGTEQLCPYCQMPMRTYAANTMSDAPLARPSSPSARFTPFDVAAIMRYANRRTHGGQGERGVADERQVDRPGVSRGHPGIAARARRRTGPPGLASELGAGAQAQLRCLLTLM